MNYTEFDLKTLILGCGSSILIFIIGLCLQVKIIRAVKEDKAMAWEINLSHSIVMIIHFSISISLETTTYVIPDLSQYLGIWFCYCSMFIRLYGVGEILLHSLFLCIYKYILIVHNNTIRCFGLEKAKKLLFWINIILPLFGSFSYTLRPNYRALNRCTLPQVSSSKHISIDESIGSLWTRLMFCGVNDYDVNNTFQYFIKIVTSTYCLAQTILSMLIFLNILEIFFYFHIFRHMNR